MTPPLPIEFSIGDTVKVCTEEWKIKELQNCKDCGGYSPLRMQGLLGKCVKVKHISQYCVRVEWENCEFDLHPNLIETIGQKSISINRTCEIRDKHAEVLFDAIESGDPMLVCQKLLPYLLNTKNNLGRTPTNASCVLGHFEVIKILIPFGTDLSIGDNDGYLPVHNCVRANHLEILTFIITTDVNQLHALDRMGRSLLHLAVIENRVDITRYLVEKNINTNIIDQNGLLACQYITNSTNDHIKALLHETTSIVPSPILTTLRTISLPHGNSLSYQPPTIECNESYYQMYLETSLLNPPKDDSNLAARASSVDGRRDNYDRYFNTGHDSMRSNHDFYSIVPPSVSPFQISRSERMDSLTNDDEAKTNECKICFSRVKEVAFVPCGHTACNTCADRLFVCHICKKEIIRRQIIYI